MFRTLKKMVSQRHGYALCLTFQKYIDVRKISSRRVDAMPEVL